MRALDFFAEDGPLARAMPGFKRRAGQATMVETIARALDVGEHALIEAPTGSGKSLAYLIPAILRAKAAGKKVLVLTAGIALSEQLTSKDLPLLQRVLGAEGVQFSFALAKGMQNFICARQLERSVEDDLLYGLEPEDRHEFQQIQDWARSTAKGDLSELPFELGPSVRRLVVVDHEDCSGKACPKHEGCFALGARASWKHADVVVANDHLGLLCFDLFLRGAGWPLLPDAEIVICDEAHELAEIAQDFFGFRITRAALMRAARPLAPRSTGRRAEPVIDVALHDRISREVEAVFAALETHRRSRAYKARLRHDDVFDASRLGGLLELGAAALRQAGRGATDDERKHRLQAAASRMLVLKAQLEAAARLSDPEHTVYHLDGEGSRVALCSKLVDPAPLLREVLFDRCETVIATSATLCDAGSSFEFISRQIGADEAEGVATLQVPSPFDHGRCLVVLPELVEPNSPTFATAAAEALLASVKQSRGRTLALFTSWRVLERAHQKLLDARLPYPILRQGEAPKLELVRRFLAAGDAVLLGVDSFWAGIDLPGQACSLVFIDRLPFPHPDDPVLDALTERNPRGWFGDYSLPKAVIQWRQGVGRLLRTETDYGVIVCTDRRLTSKGYGRRFLASLPEGIQFADELAEVGSFLEELGAA